MALGTLVDNTVGRKIGIGPSWVTLKGHYGQSSAVERERCRSDEEERANCQAVTRQQISF